MGGVLPRPEGPKSEVKGRGLGEVERSGTCYSASYTSQTPDQKRFTISEVAADWHELMIPQRTMRASSARASEQLDRRLKLADITPPQSATLPARQSGGRCKLPSRVRLRWSPDRKCILDALRAENRIWLQQMSFHCDK